MPHACLSELKINLVGSTVIIVPHSPEKPVIVYDNGVEHDEKYHSTHPGTVHKFLDTAFEKRSI